MTSRLRFAPSPTGYLHVGGARTMLFNWLAARQSGGEILLRIEDTDTERNRPELTQNILDMIEWLDLGWDGEPTYQSDRMDLYTAAAEKLLAGGQAYWCDCTAEQVQARAKERGGPPGYDGHCRDRGLERGPATALRFRTPDQGSTSFEDLVRGTVAVENRTLEDFVLLRSSGTPTFLLANIVDDAEMVITHVVRGEEHVNGTPKYLCLAEALGLDYRPVFAHLPVLVNEQRKKLSKRRDSVSVQEFKDEGYLPEAMVNYLSLLGWGPRDGVEVRPREEIVELFRLEDVSQSPAFFDVKKLQAFNADWLRGLPVDEFVQRAAPFVTRGQPGMEALVRLAPLVQERARLLPEADGMVAFLVDEPVQIDDASWSKAMLDKQGAPAPVAVAMLGAVVPLLEAVEPWAAPGIEAAVHDAARATGLVNAEGNPQLSKAQAPVRVATTGNTVGVPLWQGLEALGRDRTLDRLRAAAERLGEAPAPS